MTRDREEIETKIDSFIDGIKSRDELLMLQDIVGMALAEQAMIRQFCTDAKEEQE